jgi:hypothetical protein
MYDKIGLQIQGIAERQEESRREFDRSMEESRREFAERLKETDRIVKETNKTVGGLSSSMGRIIEHMVGGNNIVQQFQDIDIEITSHSRNKTFGMRGTSDSGQIDVFLENGDLVILVEVKAQLGDDEVREHLEQLEKYRLFGNDKRRILGAVAGAVVPDDIIKFAHRKGLFVIVQSGEFVEIVKPPAGFKPKEW